MDVMGMDSVAMTFVLVNQDMQATHAAMWHHILRPSVLMIAVEMETAS